MSSRDDIVIVPRLTIGAERSPRQKAAAKRRTDRAKRQRARMRKVLKKARRARSLTTIARNRRRARFAAKAADVAAGATWGAAKWGSRLTRLSNPIGWLTLAVEGANFIGSKNRQILAGFNDISERRFALEERVKMWGAQALEADVAARTRGAIESNDLLLGIIGRQGQVTSQIAELGRWFKERERALAVGQDLIDRDPAFDSMDSAFDKAILAHKMPLKAAADELIETIRWVLGKSTPGGR